MTTYWPSIDVPRAVVLGGGHFSLTNLKDITVLFGKNGSGKSLLLRAWRDQHNAMAHYVVPERTGEINFAPHIAPQELELEQRRQAHSRNFLADYRQRVLARIHGYLMLRGNARGEDHLPGSPADIEAMISELLPEFSVKISDHPLQPIEMAHVDRGKLDSVDQLSSGEAQLLWMAVDMLVAAASWQISKTEKRVLLLDEPDAHIHPDLLVRLAHFLVEVVDRYDIQLVVATHSTSLLAALAQFGDQKTGLIYLAKAKTQFKAIEITSHVKELASCLGGHALMGALFGAPLLIVEGDDDYRVWSEVPRRHNVRVAVIPARGSDEVVKFQRALEKVMSALRDDKYPPSGYALLDGDKVAPNPSAQNPQDYVPYLVLNCHEAENLYLTDEVLSELGTNWEAACTSLVANAAKFGDKAEDLRRAAEWDRRTVDIKHLSEEISEILDPKHVHWTARVGAVIGKCRPSGQLSEFLGLGLVNALWGEQVQAEAGA